MPRTKSRIQSNISADDIAYMKQALALAARARGFTGPNPMVGAIVVKSGKVIAKGYHHYCGGPHAEVVALEKAGRSAKGATLYVTLEPCSHFGKTPPCCDAIIKSNIRKVVVACKDPNPVNNGKGFAKLRRAGIEVVCDVLCTQAVALNEVFFKNVLTGLPFVSVKAAQSIDGKIATRRGDSKWITSVKSREFSHKLRSYHDAVLIGANTAVKDDPWLSVRRNGRLFRKQPVKVVLDSKFRVPVSANIFSKESPAKVILCVSAELKGKKADKLKALKAKGHEVVFIPLSAKGKFPLKRVLKELAKRDILSVMVEGGGKVIGGFVDEALADKGYFFIAPKIIGGADAVSSVEGRGADVVKKAINLRDVVLKKIDADFLIEGYF